MPASVSMALRVVEREALVYRRMWRGSVFSSFLSPVLFLGAMGVGVGALIDDNRTTDGLTYLEFVTPGLLAGMAMQTVAPNGLWAVMAGVRWLRFFHGAAATPLGPADIVNGWVLWQSVRALLMAVPFLVVGALLGGVVSPWGILAVPVAMLCGAAFVAPLSAFAATQESDVSFSVLLRLVLMPLFLFSGTMFPVDQLPAVLRRVVVLSPLWHAVELCRMATTGRFEFGAAAAHVAVLAGLTALGVLWAYRTFARRLTQ